MSGQACSFDYNHLCLWYCGVIFTFYVQLLSNVAVFSPKCLHIVFSNPCCFWWLYTRYAAPAVRPGGGIPLLFWGFEQQIFFQHHCPCYSPQKTLPRLFIGTTLHQTTNSPSPNCSQSCLWVTQSNKEELRFIVCWCRDESHIPQTLSKPSSLYLGWANALMEFKTAP